MVVPDEARGADRIAHGLATVSVGDSRPGRGGGLRAALRLWVRRWRDRQRLGRLRRDVQRLRSRCGRSSLSALRRLRVRTTSRRVRTRRRSRRSATLRLRSCGQVTRVWAALARQVVDWVRRRSVVFGTFRQEPDRSVASRVALRTGERPLEIGEQVERLGCFEYSIPLAANVA